MVSPMLLIALPLGSAFLIVLLGSKPAAKIIAIAATAILAALTPVWLTAAISKPFVIVLADVLPPLGIAFGLDAVSAGFALLIALSSLLILVYSLPYIPLAADFTGKEKAEVRYYAIFLLLLAGAFGLVMTKDIFNLFVFFEILCISSYLLVSYTQDVRALEAGFKYMVLGSIGSAFMLVGIGLSYRLSGSLAMADVAKALAQAPHAYSTLVSVLFILGFGVEAAIFPLNSWLPDAHASAPSSISAILSGYVIEVALVVLVRLTMNVFSTAMLPILSVLALAGVIVGEMAALGQKELKRTLAFSSIGQVSMMLFAFSFGSNMSSWAGLGQLLMHAGAKSALFLVSGFFIIRTGSHEIAEYRGLSKSMPVASAFFAMASLSLVGMPPFFGFFTKLRILEMAASTKSLIGIAGLVVILFATVIESIYLFRIVRILYLAKENRSVVTSANDLPVLALLAAGGFIVLIVIGGFVFPIFDGALQPMAAALATI